VPAIGSARCRCITSSMPWKCFLAVAFLSIGILHAQAPAAFEVASVKRNTSSESETTWRVPAAGTFSISNATARMLVSIAYEIPLSVERFLLVDASNSALLRGRGVSPTGGAPKFDILGKIPDGAQSGQQYAMLRALLADRFKLRVRKEMRPIPVYALRVAREGRLGSGLQPSARDCVEFRRERFDNTAAQEPRGADGMPLCSTPPFPQNGVMILRNAGPMTRLVDDLQGRMDRPIVDETGLSGTFGWILTWDVRSPDGVDPGPATVFSALQGQLGLKLDAVTAPREVLVVESIEMPSEN
jgi:uncharacterized protein (TIGR03435 family)